MGGKKKYIEMFGSFTEPFNYCLITNGSSATLVKDLSSFQYVAPTARNRLLPKNFSRLISQVLSAV